MRSKYYCPYHSGYHYYDSKIGIECLKRMNKTEKYPMYQINNYRNDELDIWIDNGHLDEFLTLLLEEDIKLYGEEVTSSDKHSKRYSIDIRAFDLDYDIPTSNHWQIKNLFRG